MNKSERQGAHRRWSHWLDTNPPEGVPPVAGAGYYPATFGDVADDGTPIHRADEGSGVCFQCELCRYYVPLEGPLGFDWGVCGNERSQYDGRVVFEHHTCREWRA